MVYTSENKKKKKRQRNVFFLQKSLLQEDYQLLCSRIFFWKVRQEWLHVDVDNLYGLLITKALPYIEPVDAKYNRNIHILSTPDDAEKDCLILAHLRNCDAEKNHKIRFFPSRQKTENVI